MITENKCHVQKDKKVDKILILPAPKLFSKLIGHFVSHDACITWPEEAFRSEYFDIVFPIIYFHYNALHLQAVIIFHGHEILNSLI